MSSPEKNPKDDAKKDKPELGAILPDVFSDLDDYQKKIETDWETTKSAYKNKINDILEDFIAQTPTASDKPESPARPASSSSAADPVSNVEERMERLLSRVEHTLRASEERPRLFSGWSRERPSIINISWDGHERFRSVRRTGLGLAAAALIIGGLYFQFVRVPFATPLPYIHPSTCAPAKKKMHLE
jgi:hypothetical protein